MRVLVVSQYYWPEQFQITEICESLVQRGHDVTVLTGLPNYPSGKVPAEYRKGKNRIQRKNGVTIVRSFEIPRKKGPIWLALNYHSFPLAATRMLRHLQDDYDVVYCYQLSPVMMAEPAIKYSKTHGVPTLLYCCDLWPESMKVMLGDRLKGIVNLYKRVSERVYKSVDMLVVQSPSFSDYFESVHGISDDKIRYVPQFATGLADPVDTVAHDGINFMVAGNIGRAQDVPILLGAIENMHNKTGFKLHVVGDGPCLDEAREFVTSKGLSDRVEFYGRRPAEDMPELYRLADALVLTLNGDSWVGCTLPSRLQGYMCIGKPVLAAVNGGARSVIEESGCGAVVPAGDIVGLARLLDDFIDNQDKYKDCGTYGRDYFERNFTREKHVETIEALLVELVDGRANVQR